MSKKEEKTAKIYHTTSMGHKVEITPVPPYLMDKVNERIKYPDIPTYEAQTAGGEIEVHPHDETTLESDEDKATWAKYQADLRAAQEQENENIMRVMLLKGVNVDMSGQAFEDWQDEQEFLGIELPKGKSALKIHYIETEILGDLNDIAEIMTKIVGASGVPQEVVQDAKDAFRGAISGDSAAQAETETGEVEA